MLPIVETGDTEGEDKRKSRKCLWKEIRVSTVRKPDEKTCYYGVAVGSPFVTGCMIYQCCKIKGFTSNTHIHAVSDGAIWITDQYEKQFGDQHKFTLDFYHACDYLSEAADLLNIKDKREWITDQKQKLKNNRSKDVIEYLKRLKQQMYPENESLQTVINYLQVRHEKGQLNYQQAIEQELPIGSGEVESAHRHLLQTRLKIPGAWWKLNRAEEIAQLRALRANNQWNAFWNQKAA